MKTHYPDSIKPVLIFLLVFIIIPGISAQVHVALDNWFNHETNSKTGLPFHYLWNDTAESGYSSWCEIFRSRGAMTSQLGKPEKKSLSREDIYIIVDPDSVIENPSPDFIMPDDIRTITNWVKKGGVLVVMANDGNHCGLTHLNYLTAYFGMVFNHEMLRPVTQNQYEMGAFTKFPDHPVFKNVKKIYLKEVASVNLFDHAKPVLTDEGKVIMAECKYGKGFVFAVGDPWIYNEYIDHKHLPADFENRKAAENLTDYLISRTR